MSNILRRTLGRVGRFMASADEGGSSHVSDFLSGKPLDDDGFAQTGLRLTAQNALQVSAVFACRKVISETLAMLPLPVYERVGDTGRRKAYDEPTYRLLNKTPNAWQTPFDFKESLTGWAVLNGNGYARKVFSFDGVVTALIPIHSSLIRPELVSMSGRVVTKPEEIAASSSDVQIRYMVKQQNGQEKPLAQSEVFHVRGPSLDGIGGCDLSKQGREAIALAQAMEAFGARYFDNDMSVGSTLEHPGKLGDTAYNRLQRWMESQRGVRHSHKSRILEEGMKLSRQDTKARDAQLVEARQFQIVEICRYFRVPPHKIQHLLYATFSNIEEQNIEFGTDTIQPWAVRWEQAVTRDLIVDDEKYFAEVLMNALMRGNSAQRATYYKERFYIGTISRNEIRALENENPIDGGDEYYVNSATVMLGKDGKPMPIESSNPRPPFGGPHLVPDDPTDAADEPVDEPTDEPTDASATHAFAVLLADAAERITHAEQNELEKRADKRDDREKFEAWAEKFYAKHERYIAGVLAPISRAWTAFGGDAVDVDALARSIALSARGAALDGDEGFPVLTRLSDAFTMRKLPHAA